MWVLVLFAYLPHKTQRECKLAPPSSLRLLPYQVSGICVCVSLRSCGLQRTWSWESCRISRRRVIHHLLVTASLTTQRTHTHMHTGPAAACRCTALGAPPALQQWARVRSAASTRCLRPPLKQPAHHRGDARSNAGETHTHISFACVHCMKKYTSAASHSPARTQDTEVSRE